MVITGGYTVTPHHRQNRRRERPGSRTRRTITRKASVQYDCAEGLLDARDNSVPLPSDKARPSPLLRQNFDQSWQRWKARQAEEKAIAVMDRMQLEQQILFGGDVGDDDELYRLGILYNDEDNIQDSESNITLCDVPLEKSVPMFILRHKQPKRSGRRPVRTSPLPLYLSFSCLSDNSDIARLLSLSLSHIHTIQHREITPTPTPPTPASNASGIDTPIPQSLPPSLALESSVHFLDNTPIISTTPNLITDDWTFINTGHHTPTATPSSEPEAWILIDGS